MLMYQKSLFDRYYCIKNIFSLENFGENASKTFCFPVPVMARNGMLPANVFKPPLPGQRLTSCWRHEITFATMHVTCTDDDVSFCNGPGMLTRKITKHVNCLVNTSICGNNNGNNCIKSFAIHIYVLKVKYKGILLYEILMDWNAENYIQLS